MDRLHAIEVFVRVIETGSFSAAARDLRIGQPAVSKLIAGLEARLGVRLLIRSTHQLSPTDAGQAYYEKARRIVVDADEAETAARGLGQGLEGRLRVCASVTFARLHITPKLGPLHMYGLTISFLFNGDGRKEWNGSMSHGSGSLLYSDSILSQRLTARIKQELSRSLAMPTLFSLFSSAWPLETHSPTSFRGQASAVSSLAELSFHL